MKIGAIQPRIGNYKPTNKLNKPSFTGFNPSQIDVAGMNKLIDEAVNKGGISWVDVETMRESINSFVAFMKGIDLINPKQIENDLYKKFNISSNFQGNKIVAGCTALTANIFHKLKLVQPTAVKLTRLQDNVYGNCCGFNREININSSMDWTQIQNWAINEKLEGFHATGHFLSTFIHEFMHNVHFDKIQKLAANPQYSNNQNVQSMVNIIINPNGIITEKLNKNSTSFANDSIESYVKQKVSTYGSKMPAEMYAEKGAQMIADVLDMKTLRPKNNPFAFKDFTQDSYLMKMLDDFNAGNFDPYIAR